jgi:YceI-like domain
VKRGTIRFDPATNRIRGEILVEAASGNSGSSGRDKRTQNEVLESVRYPDIVFRPDRVEGQVADIGASTVQVHGMFRQAFGSFLH